MMRTKLALLTTRPVLWVASKLMTAASTLYRVISGTVEITVEQERAVGDHPFDFKGDTSFSGVVETEWFNRALKTLCGYEKFSMLAFLRDQVAARKFEEAARAEAAVQVFEDLPTIFERYAKLSSEDRQ